MKFARIFLLRRAFSFPPGTARRLTCGLASSAAALIFSACVFGNTVYVGAPGLPGGGGGPLTEVRLYPPGAPGVSGSCLGGGVIDSPKVLLIPIAGVIGDGGGFFPRTMTSPGHIQRILQRAREEDDVDAVLLHIDSPGGSAASSDLIYKLLESFGAEADVPIYAHVGNVGASGAYYAAMAADEINADPMASIGSIGVIIRSFGLQGLMEKVGVEYRTIKSGENKDVLSPFADLTEEQRARLQEQIGRAYERFVGVILESRGEVLSREQLLQVADGRVLDASEALEAKLIDRTDYLEAYIESIRERNAWSSMQVVTYLTEGAVPPDPNLYNVAGRTQLSIEHKLQILASFSGRQLYYLWEAGL